MKLLDILLILLVAAAIPGVINRTRARLAGRKGIRFLQHLYDVRLLLRKGAVYSTTTSPLFRAVPSWRCCLYRWVICRPYSHSTAT